MTATTTAGRKHSTSRDGRRRATSPRGGGNVWIPPLDTRLIATVQRRAGARVHEAAGLLQVYVNWADLLRRALAGGDAAAAREADAEVRSATAGLRRFLCGLGFAAAQPGYAAVAA